MQRRAAEVCKAADRGAGGTAVRDTPVNWRAALGVGKRLKNVAKRHCARCNRLGSTEQAVWLTALGNGGRLNGGNSIGQAGRGRQYAPAGRLQWTACDGGLNKGNTQQDMGKLGTMTVVPRCLSSATTSSSRTEGNGFGHMVSSKFRQR